MNSIKQFLKLYHPNSDSTQTLWENEKEESVLQFFLRAQSYADSNKDTSIIRKYWLNPHKQEYKNLNKSLTQQIQQYIKKTVWGLFQECKGFFFQSFEVVSI